MQTPSINNQENSNFIFKFRIIIDEMFNELVPKSTRKLQQIFKKRSLVVYIASKENRKFLIYWKSKDIRQILSLKPYHDTLSEKDKHICEFAVEFLANSLRNGHLGNTKSHP